MSAPVAIVDSGVGGVSVLETLMSLLSLESIVYFADTAFQPYGSRSPSFALQRRQQIMDWLTRKQVKLIIIACHTLSGYHTPHAIPHLDMIEPTLEAIGKHAPQKALGLMATPLTLTRASLVRSLESQGFSHPIIPLACPSLASAIERNDGAEIRKVMRHSLAFFAQHNVGAIVHGCTHYPLAKRFMELPDILIDPGQEVALQARRLLAQAGTLKTIPGSACVTIYHTGPADHLKFYLPKTLNCTFVPCPPDLAEAGLVEAL